MKVSPKCMACLISKAAEDIPENAPKDAQSAYIFEVLRLFLPDDLQSAPVYQRQIMDLYSRTWGEPEDRFTPAKAEHNRLVARMAEDLKKGVDMAEDPLEQAIKIARAGNYIDMAAMAHIHMDTLKELLVGTLDETLDATTYQALKESLDRCQRLVFLSDNCGEIVLDRILLDTIASLYPQICIIVVVKSGDIANDVTLADAQDLGLTEAYAVMGNGTNIAGTSLPHLSPQATAAIQEADLILSKGQANFESLYGCGLNVFYLLLCKCPYFMKKFNKPHLGSLFIREGAVSH